jgi:serine/threonine protein kinase
VFQIFILKYNTNIITGSLDQLLFRESQIISDERKLELVQGIARGVLHLHKHNIVHRDLAARNILLTASGEPKISVLHFVSHNFSFFCSTNHKKCSNIKSIGVKLLISHTILSNIHLLFFVFVFRILEHHEFLKRRMKER